MNMIKLNVALGSARVIQTLLMREDPDGVTLCPEVWLTCTWDDWGWHQKHMVESSWQSIWGATQRLSSSFTWKASVWLPEETWTWELGVIQSIRFTHSSMCLPTCWVEPRRPDEGAIPPRSISKGKCLSACSMCCKLRCSHFLQEETEALFTHTHTYIFLHPNTSQSTW